MPEEAVTRDDLQKDFHENFANFLEEKLWQSLIIVIIIIVTIISITINYFYMLP